MALGSTRCLTEISRGKAVPVQAWIGLEGFTRLRLSDFKTLDA